MYEKYVQKYPKTWIFIMGSRTIVQFLRKFVVVEKWAKVLWNFVDHEWFYWVKMELKFLEWKVVGRIWGKLQTFICVIDFFTSANFIHYPSCMLTGKPALKTNFTTLTFLLTFSIKKYQFSDQKMSFKNVAFWLDIRLSNLPPTISETFCLDVE